MVIFADGSWYRDKRLTFSCVYSPQLNIESPLVRKEEHVRTSIEAEALAILYAFEIADAYFIENNIDTQTLKVFSDCESLVNLVSTRESSNDSELNVLLDKINDYATKLDLFEICKVASQFNLAHVSSLTLLKGE